MVSSGTTIIANANYPANAPLPFNIMVWQTGDNYTTGQTFNATTVTFQNQIEHLEINGANVPGIGGVFRVGAQEKAFMDDVVISGVNSYGFIAFGVDCNGSFPPNSGCLISYADSSATPNPGAAQDGPENHIEIFPAFEIGPGGAPGFIPVFYMGAANWSGFINSTINCNGVGSAYPGYFWGSNISMGSGGNVHSESCANNAWYVGTPSSYPNPNGVDHALLANMDGGVVIGNTAAQSQITFQNVGNAGQTINITNNKTTNASIQAIPDTSGYYDSVSGAYFFPISGQSQFPGNYLFTNPGAVLSVSQFNMAGANIQQPGIYGTPVTNTRAVFCVNAFWNNGLQMWSLGGDGAFDYDCMAGMDHGLGFSENRGSSSADNVFTNATFNANVGLFINHADHSVIIGRGSVNGDGSTNSTGDTAQVLGNLYVQGIGIAPASGSPDQPLTVGYTNGSTWRGGANAFLAGQQNVMNEAIQMGDVNGQSGIGDTLGTNIAHPFAWAYDADTTCFEWFKKPFATPLTSGNLVTSLTCAGALTTSSFHGNMVGGTISGTTFNASTSVTAPVFNGHVTSVSYGHSSATTCPTSTSDGSTCTFTVNWTNAFPDTNYGASCQIVSPSGHPHIEGVTTKTVSGLIVQLANGSAAQAVASGGTSMDCVGIEN